MGAFELCNETNNIESNLDSRRIREECIIALKVYDFCRHPKRNKVKQKTTYIRFLKPFPCR